MRTLVTSVALLIALAPPLDAQGKRLEFAGRSFTIQIPKGYGLLAEAPRNPSFKFVTFASAWRADRSLALIEITLVAMTAAPKTLDEFAQEMVRAVQGQRTDWQQADSAVQVSGIEARRTAWSAGSHRGVLIVGVQDSIGFSLHAWDSEPHASATLLQLERALMTFTAAPRRR